jgi:hypothetical protein
VGDRFTAELPPGLERTAAGGIDSEAAEYRSNSLRVVFDYGEHGGIPAERGWRQEQVVANGRTGTLASGRYAEASELPHGAVAHFPDANSPPGPAAGSTVASGRSLTITARCRTEQDCLAARRIFESVRFR